MASFPSRPPKRITADTKQTALNGGVKSEGPGCMRFTMGGGHRRKLRCTPNTYRACVVGKRCLCTIWLQVFYASQRAPDQWGTQCGFPLSLLSIMETMATAARTLMASSSDPEKSKVYGA